MADIQPGLVERAKRIIVTPKTEWPVIDLEPATTGGIFRSYVLILAAIPAIAGLIGNLLFGFSMFGITVRLSPMTAVSSAIAQYVLSLVSVFVLALIIDALAPSFGGTKNQLQAIKVAAYAPTASWVAGVFGIVPQLAWLGIIGGLYSLYLLYLGLPLLMRAPQEKALGYTVVTILAAILLSIVAGAIVGTVGRVFTPAISMTGGSVAGTVSLPGAGTIDLSKLDAAAKQAEQAAKQMEAGGGQGVAAVAPSALQALLPAGLGGYKRTEIESSGANAGGLGGAHAEARYEAGDNSIRLELTDMAAAGAFAALGGAMNVQSNRETATGYEKTQTVDGRLITEKWDSQSRDGSYSELVANRFMIQAEGRVADISELKRAVATIPADRLAGLAK